MIYTKMPKLIVLISGLFFWGISIAQTSLSLAEAINQTMVNNSQIKIADYEHLAAISDVDKMKSIYLPQVEASATGSITNLPLHAFGTKLQQGGIAQTDFDPASLNAPSSISNLNTQLMVRQPIINLDANAMKKALVAKSGAYQQQIIRTKNVLKHHVMQAYLRLQITYQMQGVLLQAKKTAEANLKLANDNLEAGYLQRADVLAVEVRINEIYNQLFQTENNIQNISDQLSFLMGSGFGQKYMPENQLEYIDESQILLAELPMSRSDIKAMEMQVNAQTLMVDATEKASLPRVNAFGSYELNNNLGFDDSQHGYMLGLQASWLIFNGNKNRSDVGKAKIELEKSQTQLTQMITQNKLELIVAKRKLLEAKNSILLAEKSIEQARESLRVKTDRFAEGLEKTTEILIAETTVSQKEMEKVEAIFQYQLAYADLFLMLEQN